jgi:hypothetical protein
VAQEKVASGVEQLSLVDDVEQATAVLGDGALQGWLQSLAPGEELALGDEMDGGSHQVGTD